MSQQQGFPPVPNVENIRNNGMFSAIQMQRDNANLQVVQLNGEIAVMQAQYAMLNEANNAMIAKNADLEAVIVQLTNRIQAMTPPEALETVDVTPTLPAEG